MDAQLRQKARFIHALPTETLMHCIKEFNHQHEISHEITHQLIISALKKRLSAKEFNHFIHTFTQGKP